MPPRKLVRDSVGYVFTQYVVRAALMLRGFIAARVLGPQAYGSWNAIQLVMDYGSLATLGTQQGLDQAVPPALVAEDPRALRSVTRGGLFNIVLLTCLFIAGIVGIALWKRGEVLTHWGLTGLLVACGVILLTNVAYYMTTVLRSHNDFNAVSRWWFLQALFGAGIGLGGLWVWGPWALLGGWFVGTLIATVVTGVASRHVAPLKAYPTADSQRLIRIGLPMFIFTSSSIVMRNIDRVIVLPTLGTESLGHYSLTVIALTFLLYLPDSITYVLYPQFLRRYAEGDSRPESIRGLVERVLKGMTVFVPLLCGLTYLFARDAVTLLLPKYIPGVTALRVLCFGAVGIALSNLASVVLMTLGRQMLLVPAALLSIVVGASLDLVAVKLGYGITGVAWTTFFTFLVNGSIMLGFVQRGFGGDGRAIAAGLARALAPLVIAIALAASLEKFLPWMEPRDLVSHLVRLALATVIFLPAYIVLTWPFTRGMGLRQLVGELSIPVIGPMLRRFGVVDRGASS